MPAAVPPPSKAKPPRASRAGVVRRLSIGASVILQIALLTVIVALVNGYAFKHFKRFDFSRDRKYALSPRTKQYLASLTKPVKLIVFMKNGAPLQGDADSLIEEYRIAQPQYVSIELIDPFRDFGRAAEVQAKYKLAQQENVVIVDCEGRQKVINDDKMAEVDRSGEMMGQPDQITAFTGEQAITSAIIEVSEGKKSIVYYIQGHGEQEIGEGKPLDSLHLILDAEHLSVEPLNLLNVDSVPADCSALMLLGPHYDLTEREVKLLSAYWEKGGRIIILLNPDASTPHLAGFLQSLGVKPDDDRVLRTMDLGNITGIVRDTTTEFTGNSPIAQQLAGVTPTFIGGAQSLTLGQAQGSEASSVHAEPLLEAPKEFWGETDYTDLENRGAYFNPGKDKEGPLPIAAIVEKGAVGDQRVQAGGSRLIVVGSAHFIENDVMGEVSANFFLSSLNWLLQREQLIGIPPKEVKTFTLNLPDAQVQELFMITVFAVPAGVAFLGILVWWRRRA